MKLSQTFLSSIARTQRSLVTPDPEDQIITVPSVILPAVSLPFVLENLSTVPVTGQFSTSIIVSDLADFAVGVVTREFLRIDRGVWDIAWNFTYQCSTADLALAVGLQAQLVGPPIQSVTLAQGRGIAGSYAISNRQVWSIHGDGCSFFLIMGGTAAGVGRVFASVQAQKLM